MQSSVYLVANGDLRLSANQKCWAEQAKMEAALEKALGTEGYRVQRAHSYDEAKLHGFIDSQRMGLEVFRGIPKDAPLIVALACCHAAGEIVGYCAGPGTSPERLS